MRVARSLLNCFVFVASAMSASGQSVETDLNPILGPAILLSTDETSSADPQVFPSEAELGPIILIASIAGQDENDDSPPSPKFLKDEGHCPSGTEARVSLQVGLVAVPMILPPPALYTEPLPVSMLALPIHPDQIQSHLSEVVRQLISAGMADEALKIQKLQQKIHRDHTPRLMIAFKEAQLQILQFEISQLKRDRAPVEAEKEILQSSRSMKPRVIESTNNDFDVAIMGGGYFQVMMPDGDFRYTRNGAFRMNSTGQLVTTDGYVLQPPITVPVDTLSVTIGNDGTVSVVRAGYETLSAFVGNIALFSFVNEDGLSPAGQTLFAETKVSGSAREGVPNCKGFGSVQQGFLERTSEQAFVELKSKIDAQLANNAATNSDQRSGEYKSSNESQNDDLTSEIVRPRQILQTAAIETQTTVTIGTKFIEMNAKDRASLISQLFARQQVPANGAENMSFGPAVVYQEVGYLVESFFDSATAKVIDQMSFVSRVGENGRHFQGKRLENWYGNSFSAATSIAADGSLRLSLLGEISTENVTVNPDGLRGLIKRQTESVVEIRSGQTVAMIFPEHRQIGENGLEQSKSILILVTAEISQGPMNEPK